MSAAPATSAHSACQPEPYDDTDIDPRGCRALWAAVLEENIAVALGGGTMVKPFERIAAVRWVGSADFVSCCQLVGIDPEAMERTVRGLARRGMQWVPEGSRRMRAGRSRLPLEDAS